MRVLVTGATGYVGAFTMKALAEAGHEPVAFARSLERLDAVATALSMPRPDHRLGDMRDRRAVRTALEGCDAVIHCAALVTMDRRAEREMIEGNLEGTRAVLEQAVELGLDPIVHTSSTSALFEPGAGVLTADHPIGAAKMAYARSKAACEAVARGLQERGAPITITYPSGILGPSAGTSLGETATQMAGFVAGGVMPTDRAALSIIDVRDLAALNAALIEPGRGPRRVMCGGHLVTMELLAETLRDLTGRRFPVPRTPPGVLRGAGRLVDAVRAVVPFDSAMTYEAMALVTNWEGTDDASMRAAGVRIRPLRDTFVESLSAWADAGLVTERHLGRFRPATPLPPAPPRGLRLPGWVMGSAALRAIG
ncbi:MAG: SDR family NAD(P)-dependent oxidoreductase, partial [Actinobacteria bacterium]|nr:SDR family NAD(P)-dependent oxidoreductase [Actinomycetota bacterium]